MAKGIGRVAILGMAGALGAAFGDSLEVQNPAPTPVTAPAAPATPAPPAGPSVSFSGYVDADFKSVTDSDFTLAGHAFGLEMKLTTTLKMSDQVKGYLYTAAYDGIIPGQGLNIGVPNVQFDGFTLDWEPTSGKHVLFGDQIAGQGFFNYYYYKRSAVVVPKHWVRGFGTQIGGFYAHTGVPLLAPHSWATFAKYDIPVGPFTVTPALKHTYISDTTTDAVKNQLIGGATVAGKVGDLTLNLDLGFNWEDGKDSLGNDHDLGYTILFEPIYALGPWTFSGTYFMNEKGKHPGNIPTGSYGAYSRGSPVLGAHLPDNVGFENWFGYVEPDYTINSWLTVGASVEYHDYGPSSADQIWLMPLAYINPAKGVTINPYVMTYIAAGDNKAKPYYQGGSEVILNF